MGARGTLLFCLLVTAAIGAYYGTPLAVAGADRRAHLPGRTSPGHQAFEAACDRCHTPFGGVPDAACLRCHEAGLTAGEDAHPASKFTDPRNAERVAGLDARACATCHREHAPDRTRPGGVTLPADFCAACHRDVAAERPSHAGFAFEGCAREGCHRFHDNRGLYEAFLARHLHEPETLPSPVVAMVTGARGPRRSLGPGDVDAPPEARTEAAVREWLGSAHARAGVSCGQCHDVRDPATGMAEWRDRPGGASCGGCHAGEEAGFKSGKHGVREAVGLTPLSPAMARLPMRGDALGRALGCDACHAAHAYDTTRAAVEACLGCHDDRHSRAYWATRHAAAWQKERRGEAAPGTGVSCATCHMARRSRRLHGGDEVAADHDAAADLRPRDRMLRGSCTACHGLGFAMDALADEDLVARNFNGRPTAHVESLEMVERRSQERSQEGGRR